MIKVLHNFHHKSPFILACSGGVDSMFAADFFVRGNKNFSLAYFDHGTGNREGALSVIFEYAIKHNLKVEIGKISSEPKPANLSHEEHWRNERYAWLCSYKQPVVTCHHLNDVTETWLFGALHGRAKLIARRIKLFGVDLYRPFLTNTKQELIDWCVKHNVKWFEIFLIKIPSIHAIEFENNILPEALQVNPGLLTVIKKKILAGDDACYDYSHLE